MCYFPLVTFLPSPLKFSSVPALYPCRGLYPATIVTCEWVSLHSFFHYYDTANWGSSLHRFLYARMESRLVGHRSLCSAVCIIIQLMTGSAVMYVSACKSSTSGPRTIISKGLSKVVRKARLLSLSFHSLSRHSYLRLRSFICLSLNRWKTTVITAFLPSCGPLYNAITTVFSFFSQSNK